MRITLTLLLYLMSHFIIAQEEKITSKLFETYEKYKEPTLGERRIKYQQLQPLLEKYKANPKFTVKVVGKSIEGRDLSLVSIGQGKTNVFLWSQMHGDEPTATQSIFDIFNFLASSDFESEKKEILSNLTLHFLPMLNPDGAERFQRRNMLGVDINRDAVRLQSPESQTLKRVRDSLQADFGFNLHDQSTYYNAERTEKPATISYLAPAFNYEKDINEVRANAMRVIVFMNNIIQKYAPGQVGRYNDDFEPRAFGDNIQKWGTSTILIESGGYPNDTEKQEIRKLNYVSLLAAIYTIANGNYADISLDEYEKIPENDRKLFDLKIKNATYELMGKEYTLDLGINQLEVAIEKSNDFWYSSRIIDQGDLSTYYGYTDFDATGYTIKPGKVFPQSLNYLSIVYENGLDPYSMLKDGFTYLRLEQLPSGTAASPLPMHIISNEFKVPELHLEVGINPTFVLEKDGVVHYAIVNGFLIDLTKENEIADFKNAMIFR